MLCSESGVMLGFFEAIQSASHITTCGCYIIITREDRIADFRVVLVLPVPDLPFPAFWMLS